MKKFEPNEYLRSLNRVAISLLIAQQHAENMLEAMPDVLPSVKSEHQKVINQIIDLMILVQRIEKKSTQTILSINSIQT